MSWPLSKVCKGVSMLHHDTRRGWLLPCQLLSISSRLVSHTAYFKMLDTWLLTLHANLLVMLGCKRKKLISAWISKLSPIIVICCIELAALLVDGYEAVIYNAVSFPLSVVTFFLYNALFQKMFFLHCSMCGNGFLRGLVVSSKKCIH